MVPLRFCLPEISAQQELRAWANIAVHNPDERNNLSDRMAEVRQQFASFNLPFLSLPVTTKKETALDVFIKMNTSTAPLSTYDIVVAQVEAGMGKSLHDLVAETRKACPSIVEYYSLEDLTLYASALLQNRAPTNASYMAKDFGPQLLANWDLFINGVSRTVQFLEQERVFDAARLPTDVVIPVLVALWGLAPKGLDAEGRARTALRKYLWRAFFSNRYEKSTNSRALSDFQELRPIVVAGNSAPPTIFNEDQLPLPEPQELISAGWPVRKDRLARAILALALRHGGYDLADGGVVTRANLRKREYHHLFPDAHLSRLSIADERIFLSLNCALVTWQTNRNISDKPPEHYLAERLDGTNLGVEEIKARLASHLIPYDEMVAGDYGSFLKVRSEMIHESMRRVCQGGSI